MKFFPEEIVTPDYFDPIQNHLCIYYDVLINRFVPATFCLCFAFIGINFGRMLHQVCDVVNDENMCGPIRACKCRSRN